MTSGQGTFYINNEVYPNAAYYKQSYTLTPSNTDANPVKVLLPYPGAASDPDPMPVYCSVVNRGNTPLRVKTFFTKAGMTIRMYCEIQNVF